MTNHSELVREKLIEELSSEIHDIYIIEAKRQGDVRHKDKYEDLPENIKEFDRVLARWIIARDRKNADELERYQKRDGKAIIELLCPTEQDPFARKNLNIVDFGVADNIYVCEFPNSLKNLGAE